jgi:cyanophycinase-like exopeptidase
MANGWIALHGGGEFQRGSEIGDRRLIVVAGGADARVVIVPTAAGIDYPEAAARNGMEWFKKLGARVDAAMAVDQKSANDPAVVMKVESATMLYLPGGDPVFLVNVLRNSKTWDAMQRVHAQGAVIGGASAGAMALGSKMWNPHDGSLIDGLDLIPIVTLPHFRAGSNNRAKELRAQLDRPALRHAVRQVSIRLFGIAERTSAIFDGSNWIAYGPGEVVEFTLDGSKTFQTGEIIQ